MADSVIYTEIKFKRSPGEDARMTVRTAPIIQTEAQPRLTSKLFWIIGGAVLILLITVVGLTIEIIRLHGERTRASVQSQADRPLTETPSTEVQQALSGCPSDWVQHKDLCYHISSIKLTRDSAHSSCLNISSQLADTEDPGTLVRTPSKKCASLDHL
ncbi:killer cell lectin-like receptor subfamily B member 1B allele A [Megalops cyprinoides]|uniref:killer cell lectin-like receptor subfamily B member 1B allele A n=1 Tax=Megalops cyprinoides TaxID=118141 RepID=UPI001863B3F3|nr:killer cell lectin-like receptor subfamily B member 1B allele A [Megalops cyprinoides]